MLADSSSAKDIFLSIVVPAYNEEPRIGPTVEHILEYLDKQPYSCELIVVDDGSKDGTVARVIAVAGGRPVVMLKNVQNRGKGYSVTRGVLEAQGRYIAFSDADESTPIAEISKLLPRLEAGVQVAIGSRAVDRSTVKVHQAAHRELMGRVFNLMVNLINVRGFKDTQCGFKAFEREAARDVFSRQRVRGFCFDVETVFLAVHLGYSIAEVPVEWYNSPRSTVNPITDSMKMFWDLLVIRGNALRGLYRTPVWETPRQLSSPRPDHD